MTSSDSQRGRFDSRELACNIPHGSATMLVPYVDIIISEQEDLLSSDEGKVTRRLWVFPLRFLRNIFGSVSARVGT